MKFKKTVISALLGAGVALAGPAALASHIPGIAFNEQFFTFDATAYGGGNFQAKYISFDYEAEVDQGPCAGLTCSFSETGVGFFNAFKTDLGQPALFGTGLGSAYQMYATFTGTGTATTNVGSGGVDGTFSTFLVNFFIDPEGDTQATTFTSGGVNESKSVTGNAFDVNILTGTLEVGGFHVSPGLLGGDFDVVFNVASYDPSVWGGTAFSGANIQGDFNGVNTSVTGVVAPPGTFVDGRIIGSGNVSFQSVPEPATLSLLGLGLLGLGALRSGRRKLTA